MLESHLCFESDLVLYGSSYRSDAFSDAATELLGIKSIKKKIKVFNISPGDKVINHLFFHRGLLFRSG